MDKGYLLEIQELESSIDIEQAYLNYEDTFGIVRDFLDQVVLDSKSLDGLHIDNEAAGMAKSYLKKSYEYANGSLSAQQLKEFKTQAWRDVDRFLGTNSKLIRLVLGSLWDRNGYLDSVDSDMQDNYYSTILVQAYRPDPNPGRAFREFVEKDQRAQKYRPI